MFYNRTYDNVSKLMNANLVIKNKLVNECFILMPVKYYNGNQSSCINMVLSKFCSLNIIP